MIRRITTKPWFGPKKYFGWGWRVTSWQGAVVLLFFIVLLIAVLIYSHNSIVGITSAVFVTLLFILIALLTGDPPGGRDYRSRL